MNKIGKRAAAEVLMAFSDRKDTSATEFDWSRLEHSDGRSRKERPPKDAICTTDYASRYGIGRGAAHHVLERMVSNGLLTKDVYWSGTHWVNYYSFKKGSSNANRRTPKAR